MKKTPKKYESVELELESDRRASVISARYGSVSDLKTAAYAAGKTVWEHDTWYTCSVWMAVQELKREIPAEFHPSWFGRY